MSIPLRVLMIEEDAANLELVKQELQNAGFEPAVTAVEIERDYFSQLDAEFDLVISEYALLQFDALRALQILKEKKLAIPFVVIGGKLGEELAVECMKQGAADFVLKSRLNRLGPVVTRVLQEVRVEKEKRLVEASSRQEMDQYRQIVESSPDGLALIREGKVVFMNRAGSKLFGAASPKQLVDKDLSELTHPDSQVVKRLTGPGDESDSLAVFQETFLRLDGTELIVTLEAGSFKNNGDEGNLLVFRETTRQDEEQHLSSFHSQLLAQVSDVVVAVDSQMKVSYFNDKAEQMYGLSADEAMGRELEQIFQRRWPEQGDEDAFQEALASVGFWRGECVHVTNSGQEIAVRSSVGRLQDEQGQVAGVVLVVRDITEQQQSVETLKAERNFYSSTLAAADALVLVLDREGRIMLFNGSCEQITGYSFNEVRTKYPWEFLISPEDSQSAQDFFKELRTDQFPHRYEGQWITKDSALRRIQWSDTALTDDTGAVAYVVSTGVDVTDRKEAEQAIQESADYFRSLVDNTNDVLIVIDRDGTVQFASPSVEGMLGYRGDELVDVGFLEKVHPEDLPTFSKILEEVQERPEATKSSDFRVLGKEDSWVSLKGTVRSLLEEPAVSGIAITLRDDGGQRKMEQGFQNQLDSLNVMHAIDLATSSSLDLRVAMKVVLEQITSSLKVDASCVLLFNPNTRILKPFASRGFRSIAATRSQAVLGEGLAGKTALERKLIRISNLAESKEQFSRAELFSEEEFVTYYGVPLVARGELKGVLELFNRSALPPDSNWSDFLTAVASQTAIAIDNADLVTRLQRENTDLGFAYDMMLEKVAEALDQRERMPRGHCRRVSEMTVLLGNAMGVPEVELAHLRRGALLHDLGKLRIPEKLLLKPSALTDEEWEIMCQHPNYAHQLISSVPHLRRAVDIPYSHHEKWDGSGYPQGLKGDEIPLSARVFAVVEAWDVLAVDRPYREAWPRTKILGHLNSQSGSDFDPEAVARLLELEKEGVLRIHSEV
ncbi:MAG: PAS domain S-box protein [Acidobacteriota bacterium]